MKQTIVLVSIIVVLSGIIALQQRSLLRKKHEVNELIDFKNSADSIHYYRNLAGKEVAKRQAAVLEAKTLRQLKEDERLKFIENFKAINNRLSNLESASKIATETILGFSAPIRDTTIITIDTTRLTARTFHFTDQYSDVSGIITSDTIIQTIVMEVPLEGVVYTQRDHWKLFGKQRDWLPRWFGRKRSFAEISSPNENTRITGLEHIQVRKR